MKYNIKHMNISLVCKYCENDCHPGEVGYSGKISFITFVQMGVKITNLPNTISCWTLNHCKCLRSDPEAP